MPASSSLPRPDEVRPLPRRHGSPAGVVLVRHGGRAHSVASGGRSRSTRLRMLPFARGIAAAGPATYVLRFRYRGRNAPRRDPVQDAGWALRELAAAVMTWLLVRGTGAKLLESTIGERRPGYADYVRRTSGFLPFLPKHRAPDDRAE